MGFVGDQNGSSSPYTGSGRLPPAGAVAGAPPPPKLLLPPPSLLSLERLMRSTVARAQRRLGPMSSAKISTADRLSPSRVSYRRCSRRPVTTTRVPFVNDAAAFSPRVPHATTSKYEVSSRHSPLT